jgi:sec-independent protein translocase protein TatA
MNCLAFIGPIGGPEMIVILVVGLLIFGNRLPEVGRSLGRGLMEFKRGIKGMQDEMTGLDRESDRMVDDELATRRRAIPDAGSSDDLPAPPASDPRRVGHGAHPDPRGGDSLDDDDEDDYGLDDEDDDVKTTKPPPKAGDPQPDADR